MTPSDAVAKRLYQVVVGPATIADDQTVRDLLEEAAKAQPDQKFSLGFLVSEWEDVVDAWHSSTWETYRDVARLGRKTRLPEKHRAKLWEIFLPSDRGWPLANSSPWRTSTHG